MQIFVIFLINTGVTTEWGGICLLFRDLVTSKTLWKKVLTVTLAGYP